MVYTPALSMMLKGLNRMSGGIERKRLFTAAMLDWLHNLLLPLKSAAQEKSLVVWRVAYLALSFPLRRSEIAFTSKFKHKGFILQVTYVYFYHAYMVEVPWLRHTEHVLIWLQASKTDPIGASTIRMLPRSKLRKQCPVVATCMLKRHYNFI